MPLPGEYPHRLNSNDVDITSFVFYSWNYLEVWTFDMTIFTYVRYLRKGRSTLVFELKKISDDE